MTCQCVTHGKVPVCPESPMFKIGTFIGISMITIGMSALSTPYKILVSTAGVLGVSYYFNIHEKAANIFFAKDEKFFPISYLTNSQDYKSVETLEENNLYITKFSGNYKGLSIIKCSFDVDTIIIDPHKQMKEIDGYISEIQDFDIEKDLIIFPKTEKDFIDFKYTKYHGIDYTIIQFQDHIHEDHIHEGHIHDEEHKEENLLLAVQGTITDQNIDFI